MCPLPSPRKDSGAAHHRPRFRRQRRAQTSKAGLEGEHPLRLRRRPRFRGFQPFLQRAQSTPTRSRTNSDEQVCPPANAVAAPDPPKVVPAPAPEKRPKQHKISVGFGQLGTSDLKVVLHGMEGVAVKMIVHKSILAENSTFFADRISRQSPVSECSTSSANLEGFSYRSFLI
jgi:hypothetical protein